METVNIGYGNVEGTVLVPSSKSVLQRHLMASFLAGGSARFKNVYHCEDTLACLSAIQQLGAVINDTLPGELTIHGCGGSINNMVGVVDLNESGFALRAIASVAALSSAPITLTGKGSLMNRPVGIFEKVFPQLKVECRIANGLLPIEVKGPVQFKDIEVDGSLSSQFLSGLLMIFPFAKEDHVIHVHDLKSKPYIDLTIQVLAEYGIKISNEAYRRFYIPGNQVYKSCDTIIEGDWSAAAFMLVAGAISGEVKIENLRMDSLQPDKAITEVLKAAGADVEINEHSISVTKKNLHAFKFDATHCPDLFPPLVALAAFCDGTSEITGVERLVHKESNRALALQQEFSSLHEGMVTIGGNSMFITGQLPLNSARVDAHHDHRIAMALAIAALQVDGGLQISGAASVKKSYPGFFGELQKIRTKVYE